MPGTVGSLPLLQLDLGANQIDSLPESLSRLTRLQLPDCSHNMLRELPAAVSCMTALERLRLSHNRWVRSLIMLMHHHCIAVPALTPHWSRLKGLAEDIGCCGQLQSLHASHNQLQSLPGSISRLGSLRELKLDSNRCAALAELVALLVAWTRTYHV